MLVHTVIFRLKRSVNEDLLQDFVRAVREFGQNPPFASAPAEVRTDLRLRSEGPSVSEVLLELRFESEEKFHAYLAHPKHQRLVQDVLEPRCETWLSIQSATV